jgi:glycosyltransferase involved in cell wall biosynthesis
VHVHHTSGFAAGALRAIHDMGRPLLLTLHDYWLLCPRGQMWRNDGRRCERIELEACAACLKATWPQLMPSGSGEQRGVLGETLGDDVSAVRARLAHALEMLALPQRIFSPSAAARDVFEAAGVPSGRIEVLENGVDALELAQRVQRARTQLPARGQQVRIGVLGSAQPSKGVLEFARAALSLDDSELFIEVHGQLGDYHGDPSYALALRALAAENSRLLLCGSYAHEDLARVLAGLDAVAVPSRWNEVYGLGAREARAAGLYVFASDTGGLAECKDREGVELLPAEDASAWRKALEPFAKACRAPGAARVFAARTALRTTRAAALELERHYVDLVREQLGREPALCFEPGEERPREVQSDGDPGGGALSRWWRRLRG